MVDSKEIASLIELAQNGDEEAFNKLYSLTSPILFNQIKNMINNSNQVWDILQDTYLTILEKKIKYKENGLSYLITIAKNKCLNYLKASKKEKFINYEEEEYRLFNEVKEDTYINFDDLEDNKSLSRYQKELITLHIKEGFTHKEIALLLNKPIGTILWQYNEAIKTLRKVSV